MDVTEQARFDDLHYSAADVAGLEAKVFRLRLSEGERSALVELVAQAETAVADEVGVVWGPRGSRLGGLGFLMDLATDTVPVH